MAWYDVEAKRDHPDVVAYIKRQDVPQRAHITTMRDIVRERAPDALEGLAWKVPFWFRKGPLCYASAAQHHVTIGFPRGIEIEDPYGRLTGTGKSPIRKTIVKLTEAFPEEAVRTWLEQALLLDEQGYDEDPA